MDNTNESKTTAGSTVNPVTGASVQLRQTTQTDMDHIAVMPLHLHQEIEFAAFVDDMDELYRSYFLQSKTPNFVDIPRIWLTLMTRWQQCRDIHLEFRNVIQATHEEESDDGCVPESPESFDPQPPVE